MGVIWTIHISIGMGAVPAASQDNVASMYILFGRRMYTYTHIPRYTSVLATTTADYMGLGRVVEGAHFKIRKSDPPSQ